jgi:TolB-like protein
MRPTVFLHPEFDFSYVERVAVIPFENLSDSPGAASRATRFFISELLASESFDVIEPGEVGSVLASVLTVRTGDLTKEQIMKIGKELKVQGLFFGSLNESSSSRSGSVQTHTVALVVRLVDVESGETVWSATNTSGGRGFFARLFGTGEQSTSDVMRKCVKKTLSTLVN